MGSARESIAQWWEGHYYPDAGEVIGWRETRVLHPGDEVSYPPSMVGTRPEGAGSAQPPPASAETSGQRAARRAKTRLRRYAVANRLRYMWVLTFAPDDCPQYPCQHLTDLATVKRWVASWVKRGLRRDLGYEGAYLVGWERHKSGAWHVNLLVGSFLDYKALGASWGRGNVWVSKFEARLGESQRDTARRAAAYVAKYVTKEFEQIGARAGVHRYEVAQGFAVRQVRVFGLSASGLLIECDGGEVSYRFDAPAPESGRGPPIVWAAFAE